MEIENSRQSATGNRQWADGHTPSHSGCRLPTDDCRIVEIARSWIGTPYVHQASLKGAGCDCLGLLRGIWRDLHGEEAEETPPYSLDWAEATAAETLYMALKRHAREIGTTRLEPGDVALFRMLPHGPAKHCGIVAAHKSTSPNAGRSDPFERREERIRVGGNPRAFAPHPKFVRDAHEFRPPRVVAGEALTLIHARQNKRVSEEAAVALLAQQARVCVSPLTIRFPEW
jgi:NlpC/P60 family putative phage cell wall peptidase